MVARFGMSALRLGLPYHDARMPPELSRADYIVSSNVIRTVEVCRQRALRAPRGPAQAVHHNLPYFADVVWGGLSTRHVRAGLNEHIPLDQLRQLWMPISPQFYLDRLAGRDLKTLLVYAR